MTGYSRVQMGIAPQVNFRIESSNMALIRWIFAIVVLSGWAALIGTSLYMAMYSPKEDIPEAEAIIVLAGNTAEDGGLNAETQLRVDRAVALFEEGKAETLVMTGGSVNPNRPPVAEAMRDAAIAAGVPEDAILIENASHSTLQNAMFTADLDQLDKSAPMILVSHRYHILRANASFRWAGFSNLTNVAADPEGGFAISEALLWEGVKWPLNVARAAAASAAMAGNVPRESYVKYLE